MVTPSLLCRGGHSGHENGAPTLRQGARGQSAAATPYPRISILMVGHRNPPEDGLWWQVLAGSLVAPGRRAWQVEAPARTMCWGSELGKVMLASTGASIKN
jgi:hypothetical protein